MGVRGRIAERVLGVPDPSQFMEQLRSEAVNNSILKENMRVLEMAMEDEGWRRAGWRMEREFTRQGLDNIIAASRAFYLSHPLIQRAVNVTTYYTWAQGCTIDAAEDQVDEVVVKPLMQDDGNINELYGHQAQLLTDVDLLVDGNVFMPMFTDIEGNISLRSIPADEIREIHCVEGDKARPMFYRREWSEAVFDTTTGVVKTVTKKALYPDWRYFPKKQLDSIGGVDVYWDAPVIHQKSGGLKAMQFGIPETYAALDWARAYRKFLENWHSLVASLAKFAWQGKTKGSKIKGLKDKLSTTIDEDDLQEENDMPPGQAFLGKDGDELKAIPKTGAHTSAEDARPSRLMVAASMNIPDTILSGDVDVGNFATSKTLDRPTELYMMSRQQMAAARERAIMQYATNQRIINRNQIPGSYHWDHDDLLVIEARIDTSIEVTFPPILEHDPKATVEAIVAAATLQGKAEAGTVPTAVTQKLLMEAIGVEDVAEAMDELGDVEKEDLEQAAEALIKLVRDA